MCNLEEEEEEFDENDIEIDARSSLDVLAASDACHGSLKLYHYDPSRSDIRTLNLRRHRYSNIRRLSNRQVRA